MTENKMELNLDSLENVTGGTGGSPRLLPERKGYFIYQIRKGDTLGKLGRRYNTTAEAIKAANSTIHNINDITAGYYIYIPE